MALGGLNSSDTVILKNKIYGGWSEGIFMIDGGFTSIYENQVYDNNDGIILYNSSPFIFGNEIKEN